MFFVITAEDPANPLSELVSDLRAIFAAPERDQAMGVASSVAKKWQGKGEERVAEHLEEHVEEWITGRRYLDMPELKEHRNEAREVVQGRCSRSTGRRISLGGNYRNSTT